jgi:hypothetical protein
MIDSRAKGRTAEIKARDELRKLTGLDWERTPMSGALDPKHKLKGDLYVPGENIKYCVEVKHYAEEHVNTKILTSTKPMFLQWWAQTVREAEQMKKEPLLIFKYNRSKWFAAFTEYDVSLSLQDEDHCKHFVIYPEEITICLLTDFCRHEEFL